MLIFSSISTIVVLYFFGIYRYQKDSQDIVRLITIFGICIIWTIYLIISPYSIPFFEILIILFALFLLTLYVFSFDIPDDNIEIIAKQQNYWDVPSDKVINAFKSRQSKKNGRIEVEGFRKILYILNENNEKEISPQTIKYFKEMEALYKPIFVDNINAIKEYPLYYKVFMKITSMMEIDKEVFVDYQELLESFNNRVDFFLIYLWDNYSKDFNIGIGQLETEVKDDLQMQEFINTLDNVNLKMAKLSGSYLEYKYNKFLEQKRECNEC